MPNNTNTTTNESSPVYNTGIIKAPFYLTNTLEETTHIEVGSNIDITIDNVEKLGYDYLLKLNGQMEMRIAYNAGDPHESTERSYIPTAAGFRLTKCQPTANIERLGTAGNRLNPDNGALYNLSGGIKINTFPSTGNATNLPLKQGTTTLAQDGRFESYLQGAGDLVTEQLRGSKYNDNKFRIGKKESYADENRNRSEDTWVNGAERSVAGNQIVVFYKEERVEIDTVNIVDNSPFNNIKDSTTNRYANGKSKKCVHGLIYGQKIKQAGTQFESTKPQINNLIFNSETGSLSYDHTKDKHNILTEYDTKSDTLPFGDHELGVKDHFRVGTTSYETGMTHTSSGKHYVDTKSSDGETLVKNLANILFYIFLDSVDPNGKIVNANNDTEQLAYNLIRDIESQMFDSIHRDIDFWLALTNKSDPKRPDFTEDYFEKENDGDTSSGSYYHIRRVSNPKSYTQTIHSDTEMVNRTIAELGDYNAEIPTLFGYHSTTFTHSCVPFIKDGVHQNLRGLSELPEEFRPQGNFTFLTRTNHAGQLTDLTSIEFESYAEYTAASPTVNADVFKQSTSPLHYYGDDTNNQFCRVGDVFTVYGTPDGQSNGPGRTEEKPISDIKDDASFFKIVVLSVVKSEDNEEPQAFGWGQAEYRKGSDGDNIIGNGLSLAQWLKVGGDAADEEKWGQEIHTLCGLPNKVAILNKNDTFEIIGVKGGSTELQNVTIVKAVKEDTLKPLSAYLKIGEGIEKAVSVTKKIPGHVSRALYYNHLTEQVPYGPRDVVEMGYVIDKKEGYASDNIIPEYDSYFSTTDPNFNWGITKQGDLSHLTKSLSKEGVIIAALQTVFHTNTDQALLANLAIPYLKVRDNYSRNIVKNLECAEYFDTVQGNTKKEYTIPGARHKGSETYNIVGSNEDSIPNSIRGTQHSRLRSLGTRSNNTDLSLMSTGTTLDYLHTQALVKIYIDEYGHPISSKKMEFTEKEANNRTLNGENERDHLSEMDAKKTTFIHIPDLNTGLFLTGYENEHSSTQMGQVKGVSGEDTNTHYSAELYLTGDHLICPLSALKLTVSSQDRPTVDTTIVKDVESVATYGTHFTFADIKFEQSKATSTLQSKMLLVDLFLSSKLEITKDSLDMDTETSIGTYEMVTTSGNMIKPQTHYASVETPNGTINKPFDLNIGPLDSQFIPAESINRVTYIELEIELEDIKKHVDMTTPLGVGPISYKLDEQARPNGSFKRGLYVEKKKSRLSDIINLETTSINYTPTLSVDKWDNLEEMSENAVVAIYSSDKEQYPLESITKEYSDTKDQSLDTNYSE